ncbi:hypothetical protein WH47_03371 [Habropoda laboriosa]|uniref:Uncharacterized protein n=1 Tax=Habropoda laboriosa TaxID=597456 RepID=A0A0L7RBJ8_9HYME|nr:hypothetical protein WH47_03371 [Habropoda laboriosa]
MFESLAARLNVRAYVIELSRISLENASLEMNFVLYEWYIVWGHCLDNCTGGSEAEWMGTGTKSSGSRAFHREKRWTEDYGLRAAITRRDKIRRELHKKSREEEERCAARTTKAGEESYEGGARAEGFARIDEETDRGREGEKDEVVEGEGGVKGWREAMTS